MKAELSLGVLVALLAPGWDTERAWSEQVAWAKTPGSVLRGEGAEVATVRARWNEQAVFFEITCRDRALVSPGEKDGLDHYLLGDVVEIFLARRGSEDYAEVHATPAGMKTCYFYRGYRKAVERSAAGITVRAEPVASGWRALMVLPWSVLGEGNVEDSWEILCGRYDYDIAGGRPVLSSFPGQSGRLDFHDRKRFARLELQK